MTGQRQDNATLRAIDPDRLTWRRRWTNFWRHPRTHATVRHPLFPMLVLVAVCLIVEENYPFSDFPMYSNLSPGSHYFHLTDETDQPLPIKDLFGVSASEFKKIYHSKLTPIAEKLSEKTGKRVKASDLGPEEQAAAGEQLLEQLMPRTEGRKWWKENQPSELRLIRTDIHRDDKALTETPRRITIRKLPPQASSERQRDTGVPPANTGRAELLPPKSYLLPAA
jgi:hypothetical protein